jgi:D-arabinose 1-dehydrogenase
VQILADGIREHLDEWLDYAWASPGEDYVKKRALESKKGQDMLAPQDAASEAWLTPAQSPQPLAEEEADEEGLPLR